MNDLLGDLGPNLTSCTVSPSGLVMVNVAGTVVFQVEAKASDVPEAEYCTIYRGQVERKLVAALLSKLSLRPAAEQCCPISVEPDGEGKEYIQINLNSSVQPKRVTRRSKATP